jgi:hypothetical protein
LLEEGISPRRQTLEQAGTEPGQHIQGLDVARTLQHTHLTARR